MSDQPRDVRISAADIVNSLNKILIAIEEQNRLVQTQTGILTALLKASSGVVSKTSIPGRPAVTPVSPSQLGYPGMSGGGKQHVPGALTGLEPPQWTGESEPAGGMKV